MRPSILLSIVVGSIVTVSCSSKPNPSTQASEFTAEGTAFDRNAAVQIDADDPYRSYAQSPNAAMVQVDVWHLSVPFGTVSRNDEFWKRINEQIVDVATYDLLFKNGVRVGEAPTSEWAYFKSLMDQYPSVSSKNGFTGVEMKSIEMEMQRGIDSETLFVFDSTNDPVGRTYDHCDNLMSFSFQPAPRKQGQVRIAMCPVVRSVRKRLEFTLMNEERELKFVHPEHIYNLNLRADVPLDSFLIIAPSADAWKKTSVGRAFLVKDGPAEQFEEILLVVPKPIKLEDVTGKVMAKGPTTRP